MHKKIPSTLSHGPLFQLELKPTIFLISSNFMRTIVSALFPLNIVLYSAYTGPARGEASELLYSPQIQATTSAYKFMTGRHSFK